MSSKATCDPTEEKKSEPEAERAVPSLTDIEVSLHFRKAFAGQCCSVDHRGDIGTRMRDWPNTIEWSTSDSYQLDLWQFLLNRVVDTHHINPTLPGGFALEAEHAREFLLAFAESAPASTMTPACQKLQKDCSGRLFYVNKAFLKCFLDELVKAGEIDKTFRDGVEPLIRVF